MNKQNGSALIISLLMLLVMTMLGISSMSTSTLQEKMAANDRNQKLAFQNAEIALIDSEDDVIAMEWQDDINRAIVGADNSPFYDIDETVSYHSSSTWVAGDTCEATSAYNCYTAQLVGEQRPLTLDGGYGQADQANIRHLRLNITARSTDSSNITTAMVQSTIEKIAVIEK